MAGLVLWLQEEGELEAWRCSGSNRTSDCRVLRVFMHTGKLSHHPHPPPSLPNFSSPHPHEALLSQSALATPYPSEIDPAFLCLTVCLDSSTLLTRDLAGDQTHIMPPWYLKMSPPSSPSRLTEITSLTLSFDSHFSKWLYALACTWVFSTLPSHLCLNDCVTWFSIRNCEILA